MSLFFYKSLFINLACCTIILNYNDKKKKKSIFDSDSDDCIYAEMIDPDVEILSKKL